MINNIDSDLDILEDQPITPPPPIPLTTTNSLFLGVTDFMPNVRNDAYITVKLDQLIARANKNNIRLPSTFYILVCPKLFFSPSPDLSPSAILTLYQLIGCSYYVAVLT